MKIAIVAMLLAVVAITCYGGKETAHGFENAVESRSEQLRQF